MAGMIVFSVLVIAIIFFILLYQRQSYKYMQEKQFIQNSIQQEVFKTRLETQEHTFQQIACELNEHVGQLLNTTKMLLGTIEHTLAQMPDTVLTAHATLREAVTELRPFSKSPDKEWLEQFDLIDNLKAEVDRINAGDKLKVFCECNGRIKLRAEAQIMLFRIIREALQNSIKHGNATKIDLFIHADEQAIVATISDNGFGFDQEKKYEGTGLKNMKQRTLLLRGSISWISFANAGTTVRIHLPVN